MSDTSTPTTAEVRAWAQGRDDLEVGARGKLRPDVVEAWNTEHPDRQYGA